MSIFKKNSQVHEDNRIDNWAYLWMAIFMSVGYLLFSVVYYFFGTLVLRWVGVAIIAALLVSLVYSSWKKTTNERRIVYFILFISIVLRLYYLLTTSQREYAGESYETFLNVANLFTPPDASQPLYYVLAAAIYNLAGMFRFTEPYALELVRLVTEYMGIASVIAVYYILCELEANDMAIYLCSAIVAFHPGLIIMGGEISPKMFAFMLLSLSLVFLSRWNNFTDGYNFVLMSITFGLAVMTDMSSFVFVPVVAVLIIINLVRVFNLKQAFNIFSTILKTLLGLAVWAVLSFAYPVRNYLAGQNNGLLTLLNDVSQNSGKLDFHQTFLSFSPSEMLDVYVSSNDKNAWAYLVKSSIRGSYGDTGLDISVMRIIVLIAFAMVLLALAMVVCSVFARIDAKKKVNIWTMTALLLSIVGYYMLVNLGRPVAESMSFVSAPMMLIPGVALLGSGMKVLESKKKMNFVAGIFNLLVLAGCFAFSIAAAGYDILLFE